MSFEALPNELLVKIFSHLRWKKLRDLSLVNRRWYLAIGMTNKVSLRLSKYICHRQQETKHFEDVCIPLEILCGSSREYRNFSCYLRSKDLQLVSGTLAVVLEHCQQRWNMIGLRLVASYSQFILFMQHYRNLLNDVVKVDLKVIDVPPEDVRFEGDAPDDTHFEFPMVNLQTLNLQYGPRNLNLHSPTCFVSLHTPKLEWLNVRLNTIQTNVRLTFHDCSKVRSVMFSSRLPVPSHSVPDPVELESVLPQASETTRLKLENACIASTFNAMFGNLRSINLTAVKITPTEDPLECLNLTRLELQTVMLQKPLKLRTPQLRTLICDSRVLQSLHLEDAFEADRLEIKLNGWDFSSTLRPVGLSSFRRLHLRSWVIQRLYDASVGGVWPCLGGIRELKLQGEYMAVHFVRLKDICKHFPLLNSLRLVRMIVPGNFNFVPVSVQHVSIKDCTTYESSIEFPPSVEQVLVQNLWNRLEGPDGAEICLLPRNRYAPLESEVMTVQLYWKTAVTRPVYSTRNCHVSDDELSDDGLSFRRIP